MLDISEALIKCNLNLNQDLSYWDFPGGPVGKPPHSQCRGTGFNPW